MGFYDHYCGLSGLSLLGANCDLVLLRQKDDAFAPVCVPVRGSYNRYGSIDGFEEKGAYGGVGATLRSLAASGRLKADWEYFKPIERKTFSLGQFFEMAEKHWEFENAVTFDGSPVGFMLIHADVSDAIPKVVPTVPKAGVAELAHRAFGGVEPGPSLVASLAPADAPRLLTRVIQLRSWVDRHEGWNPHGEAGQHEDEEILASIEDARKRFAGSPPLLAAVERARKQYPLDE